MNMKSNDVLDDVAEQLVEDRESETDTSQTATFLKARQGLKPGDPFPGAYNVQQRASGEIPVWTHQITAENTLEPCHESSTTRLEARSAINEHDESCVVIAAAELSKPKSDQMLIEGTKVKSGHTRLYLILGFLSIIILVAVAATVGTYQYTSATRHGRNHGPHQSTLAPSSAPYTIHLDWSIADALRHDTGSSVALLTAGQLFFDILNDTDTNYTYFGIVNDAPILVDVDSVTLSKFLSPLWNGHVLDILKAITVKGQILDVNHIHDNMVVTSMAGYPMTLQRNPFRFNNITISSTERNHIYKNGVIHYANDYPKPLAPWVRKTVYNVLLETNDKRNSDLSDFIAIIDTLPAIMLLLQDNSSITGTTLFVPTNDALKLSNITWIQQQQQVQDNNITTTAMMQQLVQNHIVSGNFVRSCWWSIPIGNMISESELRLESDAGQSLDLMINDEGVTINGNVRIVEEDIFSEYGIIQIIDTVFSIVQ